MARLQWDADNERTYETGISNTVLYIQNPDGTHRNGVAWCGVTSITETPNGELKKAYGKTVRYVNYYANEEISATLEAYTYPAEFEECNGYDSYEEGMYGVLEDRSQFSLCYRTVVGNDTADEDYAYKIHILYNCLASADSRNYQTLSESINVLHFSWNLITTPTDVYGYRPSPLIILDSRYVPKKAMAEIEDILYGDAEHDARLPNPLDIALIIYNYLNVTPEVIEQLVDSGIAPALLPPGSDWPDTWTDDSGNTYSTPWTVMNYDPDGSMVCRWKYACDVLGSLDYCGTPAWYYAGTSGVTAGTYYIELDNSFPNSSTTGWLRGEGVQFVLTGNLDAGDQICLDNYTGDILSRGITGYVYASGSLEPKQTFTARVGKTGIKLGTFGVFKRYGNVNSLVGIEGGTDEYSRSALRQYLNTANNPGAWYSSKGGWDRPPAYVATLRGFMGGMSSGLKDILESTDVITSNNRSDASEPLSYMTLKDKVFLQSLSEMYTTIGNTPEEGNAWTFYTQLAQQSGLTERFQADEGTNTHNYPLLQIELLSGNETEYYVLTRSFGTLESTDYIYGILKDSEATHIHSLNSYYRSTTYPRYFCPVIRIKRHI